MRILELFSGNGDITKMLKSQGFDCVSVDYDETKKPDIVANVYELDKDFLSQFDVIWLSPDCTTYSFASHGLHRKKGGIPVSEKAKEVDINNEKLFRLLKEINKPFICENPRGHFRKMKWVEDLYRITVYYSTYGAVYTKPTDLFSNNEKMLSFFDTTITTGTIHLDYVVGYQDFLGRCKIPDRLLSDITKALTKEVYEIKSQVEKKQ